MSDLISSLVIRDTSDVTDLRMRVGVAVVMFDVSVINIRWACVLDCSKISS